MSANRGIALTLAVLTGTGWLVVYEGPSSRRFNSILGPVLLALVAACVVWFFFEPWIDRKWRQLRMGAAPPRPGVDQSGGELPTAVRLSNLGATRSVSLQLTSPSKQIFLHSVDLGQPTEGITVEFQEIRPVAPSYERGRWRVLWRGLGFYVEPPSFVEVARDSFFVGSRLPWKRR